MAQRRGAEGERQARAQRDQRLKGTGRWARRLGMEPQGLVALAAALLLCAVGAFGLWRSMTPQELVVERADDTEAPAMSAEPQPAPVEAPAVPLVTHVHVDGAVQTAGLYELTLPEPRVNDAVLAAGGLAEDADTAALNLAAPLADGMKVHVPRVGESPTAAAGTPGTTVPAPGLININTAGVAELCQLSGVGDATATAIVEDREANGPFASKEDLMRVSGIGEKKYAKLEARICV